MKKRKEKQTELSEFDALNSLTPDEIEDFERDMRKFDKDID